MPMPPPSRLAWPHPLCRAPRAWQAWLSHYDSLTARLIAHFPQFRVQLLRQQWCMPNHDEVRALKLARREQALIREVLLLSGDTPLVFAHSVMPRRALFHGFGNIRRQGNRSLGATLYANPLIRRGALSYRRLDHRHPLYQRAQTLVPGLPKQLWARRSRFELGHSRILVSEVFLPTVLELLP